MWAVQREGEGEARCGEEGEKDREGSAEINADGRLFMAGRPSPGRAGRPREDLAVSEGDGRWEPVSLLVIKCS